MKRIRKLLALLLCIGTVLATVPNAYMADINADGHTGDKGANIARKQKIEAAAERLIAENLEVFQELAKR